ncbi:hypothetical protein [Limnothrix sp. PR1529]|nr:hypothetical protein [Limnothrix sp. PR1529]
MGHALWGLSPSFGNPIQRHFGGISAMTNSAGEACPANPCNQATGTNPSC